MEEFDLQEYLSEFAFPYPEAQEPAAFEDAIERVESRCFDFLKELGYDTSNIYQNVSLPVPTSEIEDVDLPDNFEAQYVVGSSPASTPYIIADICLGTHAEITHYYNAIHSSSFLTEYFPYFEVLDYHFFIILSNQYLVIAQPHGVFSAYLHSELTKSESEDILQLLDPPQTFPEGPVRPSAFHPDQTKLREYEIPPYPNAPPSEIHIEEEEFTLDLADYSNALMEVSKADSPIKKGKALENLAEILFEAISCLTVRETNVITRSGEIDLIVEFTGSENLTIFDYYGRFLLVECKNWIDPVPAKEVGYFETKLSKTGTNLGILFAWSGISGEEGDEYAQRLIDTVSNDFPTIIVFDERDLYRIAEGTSFYEMIDAKLYRRRFDL